MATLYLIAGMGLDERCFSELLPLLQWEGELQFLPHLLPAHSRESLAEYAQRLRAQLPAHFEQPPSFIGMSLGGMISAELCKLLPYRNLVLISTLKTAQERPLYLNFLSKIPIHRLFPADFSQKYGRTVAKYTRVIEQSKIDLVFDMIEKSPKAHLAWGRNAAIGWQAPKERPARCFHIHGDKDHIFPARYVKADYWVRGGNHNIILERAEEIAPIINQILSADEKSANHC